MFGPFPLTAVYSAILPFCHLFYIYANTLMYMYVYNFMYTYTRTHIFIHTYTHVHHKHHTKNRDIISKEAGTYTPFSKSHPMQHEPSLSFFPSFPLSPLPFHLSFPVFKIFDALSSLLDLFITYLIKQKTEKRINTEFSTSKCVKNIPVFINR